MYNLVFSLYLASMENPRNAGSVLPAELIEWKEIMI